MREIQTRSEANDDDADAPFFARGAEGRVGE